ncbi:MAG TPA: hypothetical protein V6C65_35225 [Allocoleopsis sp.]
MIALPFLLSPLFLNTLSMWVYFAAAQTSVPSSAINQDPLVSQGGENAIYLGLALIVIAVSLILGKIFQKLEIAILFALTLAAVLILFIWFV